MTACLLTGRSRSAQNSPWRSHFSSMKRLSLFTLTSLILSLTFPPAFAHESGHSHTHEGHSHTHSVLEIPSGSPVPSVNLKIHPDAMRGWNLEVQVSNFQFAPERVNTQSKPTEGHAHLYINGQKMGRLYSSWYHLEALPPGRHEIKVTLNANGHEDLYHNGQPIAATQILEVPVTNH
ncbi:MULTISPECIES: hypothetical protein [Desertifilum]|uniref:Uncharacterized protein n=2 Tax=Desertifilum tharense IPPAS B-1220 TaxID=1781255 RepID=A0ACD5H1L9_9CYAN|nr:MULTISPECIES: hypothetical protein [Desertifilum]MDA0212984.1 hypothetical protein [Cyanobacteria bacterium FC1]